MTTPSATTASTPDAARRAAATGSSKEPGTRSTSTSVTPASASPRRAPARSPSITTSCQLAATTAIRRPLPSRCGSGLRIAVVAASWHDVVMDGLLAGARRGLAEAGVTDVEVLRVPGSFELPVAAARLAASGVDAVVALGVVIRGGTPHFEYVCTAATLGLTEVTVRTGVPVGFGLLTCDDEAQALDRAGLPGSHEDKGAEAAKAAVATALVLRGRLACRR